MDLDEMKLAWNELDARIERNYALNLQLRRGDRTAKARRSLRVLVAGQVLRLGWGIGISILGATFWAMHLQPLHLLLCGVLVQAYGLVQILLAANNFRLAGAVDYAAPVVGTQRRVAEWRTFRVRVEAWVDGVAGWFLWIPVTWMLLAWAGLDPWGSWALLGGAIAISCVGLAASVWLVAVLRRKGHARRFDDQMAGRSIVRAQAALAEIERFGKE